jgi:hypothetical protein
MKTAGASKGRPRAVLILVGCLLFVAGCSRTVIGGYKESADNTYCLWGRVYGAYGRSFTDNTTKRVRVTVTKAGLAKRTLFEKEYVLQGANVGWNAAWQGNTNVALVLFEYAAGVNPYDLSKPAPPTNYIRTVILSLDARTSKFKEAGR